MKAHGMRANSKIAKLLLTQEGMRDNAFLLGQACLTRGIAQQVIPYLATEFPVYMEK